MGTISYDGIAIEFEDRLLQHLQVVIMQQFRRRESFAMSWKDAIEIGDGRSSIWLHPECTIYFKFVGSRVPAISSEWLATLTQSARSSAGLVVTAEDGQLARSTGAHVRF